MGSVKLPVARDRCGDADDGELARTTYGYHIFVSETRDRVTRFACRWQTTGWMSRAILDDDTGQAQEPNFYFRSRTMVLKQEGMGKSICIC